MQWDIERDQKRDRIKFHFDTLLKWLEDNNSPIVRHLSLASIAQRSCKDLKAVLWRLDKS